MRKTGPSMGLLDRADRLWGWLVVYTIKRGDLAGLVYLFDTKRHAPRSCAFNHNHGNKNN